MYQSNSKVHITPKIITPTGYIKRGFTEEQKSPIKKEREGEIKKLSREEGRIMRDKMMVELCNILKTQKIECRYEAYQIMEEEGFLPIVAQERVMGFARFKEYYTEARRLCGINSFTGSKSEYILANYKTKSKQEIADYIGCKVHYVSHTIYRSQNKRSKKNG